MNAKEFVKSLNKEQFDVLFRLWLNYCKLSRKYTSATKKYHKADENFMFDMMIAIDDRHEESFKA